MNPFKIDYKPLDEHIMDMKKMYPKAYDKAKTSPYTKTRVILLNGTEFESCWFMHQFARNCDNDEIKKELAVVRAQEQMQQKRLACLKPINESILETTIAYEQLAIDLTATLAQREKDKTVKKALDFALLEDFDHLYRFSNLLSLDKKEDAAPLVGKFTEITPGRPTIAHHRYPKDNIKPHINAQKADLFTKLVASTITAAEQQTMNYYMNISQWYKNDLGRKLYAEIAMVEEEHVSQYESLKDPTCTWLEQWVMHEYLECYLYYSAMQEEKDAYIKSIFEDHFNMEVSHLNKAVELLKKHENTDYKKVIGTNGDFPEPLTLGTNKQYVREILERTVTLTGNREDYIDVYSLPTDADFFNYQKIVIPTENDVPSHLVIEKAIAKLGKDYRYEDKKNPVKELQDRTSDNTTIGRTNKA
ncbi:MAG: hypothetical protein IKC11_01040 [Clostridia bacterium]|nr:hypothetical protein [Clostridia bacterium]